MAQPDCWQQRAQEAATTSALKTALLALMAPPLAAERAQQAMSKSCSFAELGAAKAAFVGLSKERKVQIVIVSIKALRWKAADLPATCLSSAAEQLARAPHERPPQALCQVVTPAALVKKPHCELLCKLLGGSMAGCLGAFEGPKGDGAGAQRQTRPLAG